MKFIADLHVHSKFSRATAKNLDLEHLYIAAQIKGITVVGTGDFTHPGWFAELTDKLVPAEEGLFALRPDIAHACDARVPACCRQTVRFILQAEISNIYKKADKTRKNHNLVFLPSLEIARTFNDRLDRIGNIRSDGRPILGLDARDLLEIALETTDRAFFVPAHIWTPWFSLLGSKSGFDSVSACFEDLTEHIYAVETGLSSDPDMNRRVSQLDNLTMISNSDAHSPANLGREANHFNTDLNYDAMVAAMRQGDPATFPGTLEFYPEEGKYHLDGHRKCGVRMDPEESMAHGGRCPVCGKPVTLGVLYRVAQLADRQPDDIPRQLSRFHSIIPLTDILSEVFDVGPKTKTVTQAYQHIIGTIGPEFDVLRSLEKEQIDRAGITLLAEAIARMRCGQVTTLPGYDGEYGNIRLFTDDERNGMAGQRRLFQRGHTPAPLKTQIPTPRLFTRPSSLPDATVSEPATKPTDATLPDRLNPDQREAVEADSDSMLIVAGPGTGKTHTLTCRIAHLIRQRGIAPRRILAVTFTHKAAREMRQRLAQRLGAAAKLPTVSTFHAQCLEMIKTWRDSPFYLIDDVQRHQVTAKALARHSATVDKKRWTVNHTARCISLAKQQLLTPVDDLTPITTDFDTLAMLYGTYQDMMAFQHCLDYEDLIMAVVCRLETDAAIQQTWRKRFQHVFVDEYQDINYGQYRLIRALLPSDTDGELCAIGDPNQAIYAFRGSDAAYFNRFCDDYPQARVIRLQQNYRSTETILQSAYQAINDQQDSDMRVFSNIHGIEKITVMTAASAKAEAVGIGKTIEKAIGGSGFHSIDFGHTDGMGQRGFADFAVLYRTADQGELIEQVLTAAGIPCQRAQRTQIYDLPPVRLLLGYLKLIEGAGTYTDLETVSSQLGSKIGPAGLDTIFQWGFDNQVSCAQLLDSEYSIMSALAPRAKNALSALKHRLIQHRQECHQQPLANKLNHMAQSLQIDGILAEQHAGAWNRLRDMAGMHAHDVPNFLAATALESDTDIYEQRAQKVALMTMHAAKGLEFDVVFIAGCEAGLIPFRRAQTNEAIDEERRLFFVALTRAREQVFLCHARRRHRFGKICEPELSPFVADIDPARLTHALRPRQGKKKEKQAVQLGLF